jgi:hypothetical protein
MFLRNNWWSMCAVAVTILNVLLICTPVDAGRRRRNNYSYNYNYTNNSNTTSTSTYVKRIAPKRDAGSADLKALTVSYDYDRAKREGLEYADNINVFLWIKDKKVLASNGPIVAEVKFTDLSNYHVNKVLRLPVEIDRSAEGELKPASFTIRNDNANDPLVEPAKIYRLFVKLRYQSENSNAATALGRVPAPYYVATSGDSRMERARHQIVMRTFKEFYYRQRGWRTGEKYSMDCYAYYMWATGFCTVGAKNERTQLASLFSSAVPYNNGKDIPKLDGENPIHGDYVRKPGHSFMLLAYDPQLKHVWTMEGNFNSTVEVAIRSISSSWKVGHLRDRHIRPGLFERLAGKLRPRK